MKIPLLSICIPTYNREKYLQECLDSIVQQDGFNIDEIEIIISDNASQDNTEQLVHMYSEKYPNIHYHKNQENIGADRNVIAVLKYGKGSYLWWLSDDDILLSGALNSVMSHLIDAYKNGISFIQTNFNVLDNDTKCFSQESYIPAPLGTSIYQNIPELYKSYGYCHNGLSFFSIDIFHSKIHQFDLDTIPITQYPHSCIMWLISNEKAMFININAVWFRQNNSSSVVNALDFFRIFVINHIQYMMYLKKIKSSIPQIRLSFIAWKMVIYSAYLAIKLPLQKLIKKF